MQTAEAQSSAAAMGTGSEAAMDWEAAVREEKGLPATCQWQTIESSEMPTRAEQGSAEASRAAGTGSCQAAEGLAALTRVVKGQAEAPKAVRYQSQVEGMGPVARLGTGPAAVDSVASVTEEVGSLAVHWIEHLTRKRSAASLVAPPEAEKLAGSVVTARAKAGLLAGFLGLGLGEAGLAETGLALAVKEAAAWAEVAAALAAPGWGPSA